MKKLTSWLANELPKYWKTVVAILPVAVFVGAEVVQAVQEGSLDGVLTATDVFRIVAVGVAAYGVYQAKNKPLDG